MTNAQRQLLVGVWNAWVGGALTWAVGTGICGLVDPLVGMVGWLACGLVPFGALEILVALHALRSDDPARWTRRLAVLQVASVLIGGLPSALVGARVLRQPDEPLPR